MSSSRWSRRTFLGGLGAGAALLPSLIADHEAQAAPAEVPKRMIIVSTPNGVRPSVYWPTGTERSFTIATDEEVPASEKYSPLAPLIPFQDDIIFMGGIDIQNGTDCTDGGLSGHQVLPFLLTGARGGECPVNPNDIGRQATGPSIDRFVGKALRERHGLRYDSLVIKAGKRSGIAVNDGYMSFDGPPIGGLPNAPSQFVDPLALYDDLFSAGLLSQTELMRKKSVLDVVGADLERFRKNLGKEDRARVEQHLQSIREVERQLAAANSCGLVPLEKLELDRNTDYVSYNGNATMDKVMRAQAELTVLAMSCDATRVATLLWPESSGTFTVFHWLGEEFVVPGDPAYFANAGNNQGLLSHHELAHLEETIPDYRPMINRACQWYMEEFTYIVHRLSELKDVDGSRMLDNSVALYAHMQRTGNGHEVYNLPWIMAGSCGGYFDTGRFLPWPSGQEGKGTPQNGVLIALANAMGVPVETFGSTDYGGELTVLKA